jgi:transaldolase
LGKRYFALNPDWYIIKVPLTPEGYLAVRKLSDDGIPVNYTLGFSARQNYLASHLSMPAYVNVFLGRLNQVAADNKLSDGRNIGEKVCLASQKAITQARTENTAIPTKQIAASLRSGKQCLTLAGVDVHTIPPKAANEFLESIPATDKIEANLDADLPVVFDDGKTAEELGFEMLWTLDEAFCKFAKQAAAQSSALVNGKDLVELAADCGVADLFYPFTESDLKQITDDGKIPVLARWIDRPVALDDLMTVSALQSFSKDQAALDARILDLAGKA